MKGTRILNKILLFVIIVTASCFICSCGKSKENKCEEFLKEQFKQLCNVDVEITDGRIKEITYEDETRYVYSCKVKIGDEFYDTVATLDKDGNMEMYSMYEYEFFDVLREGLKRNDYWGYEPYTEGKHWGLKEYCASLRHITTDVAFLDFAEALTKLDMDALETGYFVRVSYLNNNVLIPIRSEYTAENYIDMLEGLLPDIEIIPKENKHQVMFTALAGAEIAIDSSRDSLVGYNFTIYYDGTISYTEKYINSGDKLVGEVEMSDYDYSLIRGALQDEFIGYEYEVQAWDGETWVMIYYDANGEKLESFQGYIYFSDLLEYRFWNLLYKYRLMIQGK